MFLLFLNQLIPEPLIRALCWTFVHSLWQGIVAALVSAIIIAATKRSTANIRYNLLVFVFAFFLVAVGASFLNQLEYFKGVSQSEKLISLDQPAIGLGAATGTGAPNMANSGIRKTWSDYLNEQAPLIVLLWSLFFLANCIRLFSGLYYIRSLRHSATLPVEENWKALVEKLSKKLAVSKKVVLLESCKIQVPIALGYLKATIIVPIGLLANLPSDQVETILLHELAHIRRRDYVVNLLQSCAETVFFFNPAMLWISSLIRREREACCDDMVLRHTVEKKSYFEALVSFHECAMQHGQVLALTKKKNHLLYRVQRMLQGENQKLNSMEKTVLMLGIIGVTAFGFINKKDDPALQLNEVLTQSDLTIVKPKELIRQAEVPAGIAQQKKETVIAPVVTDTVPAKKQPEINKTREFSSVSSSTNDDGQTKTYQIDVTGNDGRKYQIKKVNGVLTEFTINGEKADPALKENAEIINRIEEKESGRADRIKQHMEEKKKEMQIKQQELQEKREEISRKHEERVTDQKAKRAEQEKQHSEMKMKYAEQQKLNKEINFKKAEQSQKLMLKKMEYANASRKIQLAGNGEVGSIITDLKKRNLISDEQSFSFSLNNKELLVNGTRQPADLHQSLKEKYIQKDGDIFIYSKKGSSTSMTINKE